MERKTVRTVGNVGQGNLHDLETQINDIVRQLESNGWELDDVRFGFAVDTGHRPHREVILVFEKEDD